MAFAATTVWEVRTTGSDSNGGGFDSSLSGTDYSQQTAAQASGTVTSSSTTVTATTSIFTSVMVGNFITDGTTWKEITAYTSGTIVTVDSAPSWTAASIKVGGCLATLSKALALGVASNRYYVKSGTYTISANPTINAGGPSGTAPQNTSPANRITGYNATRGDNPLPGSGNQPVIKGATGVTTLLPLTSNGWWIEYMGWNCNSIASTTAISSSGYYCIFRYNEISNFTAYGVNYSGSNLLCYGNEITGGTSSATASINNTGNNMFAYWNFIHDNVCSGITNSNHPLVIQSNVIVNNTGSASDGIFSSIYDFQVFGNTICGNGRDGIRYTNTYLITLSIKNNIIGLNGGYGLNFTSGSFSNDDSFDGNFYGSGGQANTSGQRNGNGTGTLDVSYSVAPFTGPITGASQNWTLNNTASGGAAIRAAAYPGGFAGAVMTGYLDGGALQSMASGGSGGMLYIPNDDGM